MTTPDLVHILAAHAADLSCDALPDPAREAAKMSLVDTLGVSLAATGLEPAANGVLDIVTEAGGAGQATLLATGGKAPAPLAALANGALAHGLDFDDMTPWGQHCSSTIVPAVFALAERQGGVSGKDMIAAVAAGQDIFARLLCHAGWKKDWNASTVLGVFAGTAAGARVAGLDAARTAAALGIATMHAAGLMEMVAGRGSDLRGLYAGFSAQGAVQAVLLAQRGIGGIDRAFEGPNGVFACYFGGICDRDAILDGLGREFLGAATLYKPWPCVGTAHAHMKAAIDIVTDNDVAPDDIAAIRLYIGDFHALMSEPLAERQAPTTLADAKFSLPFLVAAAIARRGLSVGDFTPEGLADAQVLGLARKVSLCPDPALDWTGALPPGRVEIAAVDGRRWTGEGRNVPGSPGAPLGWPEIGAKFRDCAAHATFPLSEIDIEQALTFGKTLETQDDATALVRAVAPQGDPG